ncbi:MAG: nuclear transport factor 2 family protein [Bacteroidota bacterium]|nr:nuclear transport factor 2 family protein [Bacteroidota bacterium]
MKRLPIILPILMFIVVSCGSKTDEPLVRSEVLSALDKTVEEWNSGRLEGYLGCYDKTDSLRFLSDGTLTEGWDAFGNRLRNAYSDVRSMGVMRCFDLDVDVLSPESASAFGRWMLSGDTGRSWGFVTMIFRKTDNGWKIVHEHRTTIRH